MIDTYEARGYGGKPVGFGAKPGIVVADFQTFPRIASVITKKVRIGITCAAWAGDTVTS